ncbi:MAG: DUF1700 domain-containing protein [Clostridia bacterium]|nr:DUF1700 domain-containing protein [Clostridia bacterium]
MNKKEFLAALKSALAGLPQSDIEERAAFYGEIIDDRMEEGLGEEEAVASVGPVDAIREQILADTPLSRIVKEKVKPERSLRAWEIVLLILGFPLWFPLLAAAGAVVLSLYVVIWSLVLSLWAIEVSLWGVALGMIVAAVTFFLRGSPAAGVLTLGAGLFSAGLSIFLFFGCVAASKGVLRATGKAIQAIKRRLIRKEQKA